MSKHQILIALILALGITCCANAELVGWWKLNETEGTEAADSTGNELHGKVTGGTTWIPNGRFGGALEFDGVGTSGTNVSLPISQLLKGLTNSTFAIWANFHQTGGAWQRLWDFGDGTANGYMFLCPRIGTTATGTLRYASTLTSNGNEQQLNAPFTLPTDWHHVAIVLNADEGNMIMYVDGEVIDQQATTIFPANLPPTTNNWLGQSQWPDGIYDGALDDFRIYDQALTQGDIAIVMTGAGAKYPLASSPKPANGALHTDTWVTLSWKPGDFAVSHDVYLGESLNDVNDATKASGTFRGNQIDTYYVAGFPGFAYPDGLVPGTTYYWRIDEVNTAEPNSPWKGPIWSFSIPPKKAYNPVPANGAESVDVNVKLSWTPGFGAKLHTVYFGTNFDTVANATGGVPRGVTTYSPTGLKRAKTYYWRVDEFDSVNTFKGDVWSFTTQGAVGNPIPANGAVDITQTPTLSWTPGAYAASHEVYFGTNAEAVRNATNTSPEFKATKTLGDESYAPDKLAWTTTYFWRIDEVNNTNPDSPWIGRVWTFTTAGFAIVDDFEDYDAADNQIWYAWHDGLGYGTPSSPPYFAGNGTGAAVGDETTASFTEETIVHGGSQAMPVAYDNNKQGFAKYSEVEFKLTAPRDWTEEGVSELSVWFRGLPASVGSFTEAPAGTFTMTASGADIWDLGTAGNYHDEFHFAYKTLTGAGSIIARVQSVQNTNGWAKAGVMIRETLDGGSRHMFACITPSNGVAAQGRPDTGAASFNANQTGITAPRWLKLERDLAGNFTVSHSANGTTWSPVTGATPQNVQMGSNVYIGLAVTAHNATATCQAVFTNVTTTGTVGPQWAHQDIGIASNAAEPLYVAVSNAAGQPAVVVHPDPKAAQITTWTEWVIPLSAFSGQGINLTNVDKLAIGLGTRGNMTTAGGSGKMYFDDIRLIK